MEDPIHVRADLPGPQHPHRARVLEQALFVRRRGDAQFTATGLVHHSDSEYVGDGFWAV